MAIVRPSPSPTLHTPHCPEYHVFPGLLLPRSGPPKALKTPEKGRSLTAGRIQEGSHRSSCPLPAPGQVTETPTS